MSETISYDAILTPSPSDTADERNSDLDTPVAKKPMTLCHICRQNLLDPKLKLYKSLPQGSWVDEESALTNERLTQYCDREFNSETNNKPLHKITCFTVYDKEGHVCPFDTGIIENGESIFLSGYIKPIYDDDCTQTNGVPSQGMGPILEWWISGYDGGDSFIIGLSTPYSDYVLMAPSPSYLHFMRSPKQKALLTKIVIEFLSSSANPTYEDLLIRVNEVSVPEDIDPFDEESLREHAQFIFDQIQEIDDKKKLVRTPAAREMVKKFKVKKVRIPTRRRHRLRESCRPTTTPLVREKFGFFFNEGVGPRKREKRTFQRKLSKFTWEPGSDSAVVNGDVISVGDFVSVMRSDRIFRVEYFFQQNFTKQAHCVELIAGEDTILGEASYPNEFFFVEECRNQPICQILGKVEVVVQEPARNWEEFREYKMQPPKDKIFVQKRYLHSLATFDDFKDRTPGTCGVCCRREVEDRVEVPIPVGGKTNKSGVTYYDKIIWRGEEYSPECCVYLEPFCIIFDAQKSSRRVEQTVVTLKADEELYPELYRKAKEVTQPEECPEPFAIGCVKNVFSRNDGHLQNLFITINKFYRPENTRVIETVDKRYLDMQLLFWSNEEAEVLFKNVRGRCDVIFSKTPPPIQIHPQFYFYSSYDAKTESFTDLADVRVKRVTRKTHKVEKLKTFNAFAGVGGLAEGLQQSEVVDLKWAIDNDKPTCVAFRENFPNVVLFEMDCNVFLKDILSDIPVDNGRYPVKGEIEFLCGGPPCQGFSVLNRFSSKDDARCQNSLILTYLSLCDYYRPKYFLLENVRNFALFKRCCFLKHSLSCLLAMGYQCSFGVIQAGNYGIPQRRRRLFIMAAAPGLALPNFPKPTHVFYGAMKNLEFDINGSNFQCRLAHEFSGSAPYRLVTVRDAVWNLLSNEETFYKRYMRGTGAEIQDHVSKEMTPINEARVKHIPAAKGCDWRDLPNIRVRLRDGTISDILKYKYHDRKNGKSCCGLLRGVCGCASGKPCEPSNRQNNTLIPWFLVHSANRNNNWIGSYGRLDWDGVFSTVTAKPEPSSQQGKILHPEENRVISVRESARAQGLPDSLKLYGSVADKYKQVGNAVPCPVARALGVELKSSLFRGPEW